MYNPSQPYITAMLTDKYVGPCNANFIGQIWLMYTLVKGGWLYFNFRLLPSTFGIVYLIHVVRIRYLPTWSSYKPYWVNFIFLQCAGWYFLFYFLWKIRISWNRYMSGENVKTRATCITVLAYSKGLGSAVSKLHMINRKVWDHIGSC